jgi:hypothetical protein
MQEHRRWFFWARKVVATILTIVGYAGMPDDLTTWGKWLSTYWRALNLPSPAHWLLFLTGVVILFVDAVPYVRKVRLRRFVGEKIPDIELSVTSALTGIHTYFEPYEHISTQPYRMLHFRVANLSSYRQKNKLLSMRAHVQFYDKNWRSISPPDDGLWMSERGELRQVTYLSADPVDIPSGTFKELLIAIAYEGDRTVFGISQESIHCEKWTNPDLDAGIDFYLQISLEDQNMRKTESYVSVKYQKDDFLIEFVGLPK